MVQHFVASNHFENTFVMLMMRYATRTTLLALNIIAFAHSDRVLHSNFTNMVDAHHDYIKVEQDAADIVKASSELAYLMKIGVKQLISEIYSSSNNRKLTWYDTKGGMGNQLGGVSGALILGACSGRKIQLGIRSTSSVSRWLWRDYFEMPLPDWIAKSKDIHKGHRILKGSNISKKKPLDILKVKPLLSCELLYLAI